MSDNLNMQSKRRASTVKMVQLALLSAIMVVLAVTPLGMINLGFINATTLHIPVIVGAILLGPKAGAFLGGVFGLISLITNTIRPNLSSFAFSRIQSFLGLHVTQSAHLSAIDNPEVNVPFVSI